MNPTIDNQLEIILNSCLIFDLETSSFYPNSDREVNIHSHFNDYVKYAQVKWFGAYSYKLKKSFHLNALQESASINNLLSSHNILIGFNSSEFDIPILVNNNYISDPKLYLDVDCMKILGKSSFCDKKGYPYKNRGTLMDYDFTSNSLKAMALEMKLEHQKGNIDYKIFHKIEWTPEEIAEIIKYLADDILVTKTMFDKLWSYWLPFTEFLSMKSILDLTWIRGSIASVIYKSVCNALHVEPTYQDKVEHLEEMGGNVIEPVIEEARNVWYVDFASLYPHIMAMFNLFSEVTTGVQGKYIWRGNEVFKVKGAYDVSRLSPLAEIVKQYLIKRLELKKKNPDDPMVYTLKIWLNGLYGVLRSPIFEQVHKPNAGWDTCWLGQQFQKILQDMMLEFGFNTIGGDTDSLMLIAINEKNDNEVYVKECLQKVVDKINQSVPFKIDTFSIAIAHRIEYILFPFELQSKLDENGKTVKEGKKIVKELRGKKKNYLYIYDDKGTKKVEIVGLPIKKNNATKLGMEIYNKVLEPLILTQGHAKFPKSKIDGIINEYLKLDFIMEFISQEYKVKPFKTYKKEGQIQAQISKEYLFDGEGVIRLIKNKKVGKVGKGKTLYCTIEEAKDLTAEDLDLEKLYNELAPFVKEEK